MLQHYESLVRTYVRSKGRRGHQELQASMGDWQQVLNAPANRGGTVHAPTCQVLLQAQVGVTNTVH